MTPRAAPIQAPVGLFSELDEGPPPPEAVSQLELWIARRTASHASLAPMLAGLVVRRSGLPDWWSRENLLLTPPDFEVTLSPGMGFELRRGNFAVVGQGARIGRLTFSNQEGFTAIGSGVTMELGDFSASNAGTIVIGEACTAMDWARVDARNGGTVAVGPDGMWGSGVNLLSDDMHAIREVDSGRRTNGYGGQIVLGRHVWLCNQVRVLGGAAVGADTVVGWGSLVRSPLPANSVCVGTPARVVRRGVTWTREDLP